VQAVRLVYWLHPDALRHCTPAEEALKLLSTDGAAWRAVVEDALERDAMAVMAETHAALTPMNPHGAEFLERVPAQDDVIAAEGQHFMSCWNECPCASQVSWGIMVSLTIVSPLATTNREGVHACGSRRSRLTRLASTNEAPLPESTSMSTSCWRI
jgi:hypothetical protein